MDNGAMSYRRYLDGDKSAFAELEEMYFEHLTFFVNRYVNDIESAKDIAIDSFVELVVHPHRFKFKTPLKTYLFAIGRNKAINYAKRRNRFKIVDLSEAERAAEYDSLEETVIAGEQKRRENAAVSELPEDMRVAVHLIYFENLSYDDAARIMKKNRKQVYNLMYRAKAALRSMLGEEDELLL